MRRLKLNCVVVETDSKENPIFNLLIPAVSFINLQEKLKCILSCFFLTKWKPLGYKTQKHSSQA